MGNTALLLFGEFVSSNNFLLLLTHKLHLVSSEFGLGTYLQGIPIQPSVEFVWGTNAGIRTLPVLLLLTTLQKIFSNHWSDVYLFVGLFLPLLTSLISFRLLKKIDMWTVIAALFYTFNPWIINRLSSGFWQLNLVYAFLPFLVVIPEVVSRQINITIKKYFIYSSLFALCLSIVLISQPHFLIMISPYWLLLLFRVIIKKSNIGKISIFFILSLVFFVFLNIYFLLPGFLFSEVSFTAPQQYFSIAAVRFNGSASTLDSVLRFSPFISKEIALPLYFFEYFFILLTLVLFITSSKNRKWIFGSLIVLLIFLAKGVNDPFSQFSSFIYNEFSILHYFRDPPRFVGAIALFTSLIIGLYTRDLKRNFKILILIMSVSSLLISNHIFIKKQLPSVTSKTTIPADYLLLQNFLSKTSTPKQRILTLPNNTSYTQYPFYRGELPPPSHTLFDMAIPLKLDLVNSTYFPDNYSSQISAFLTNKYLLTNDTRVLRPLHVNFLLFDKSIMTNDSSSLTAIQEKLDITSGVKKSEDNSLLSLYQLSNDVPKMTLQKPIFAIGDFNLISDLYQKGNTSPVILLNQTINKDTSLNQLTNEKIITNQKDSALVLASERLSSHYSVDILKDVWNYDKSFVNCEPDKIKTIITDGNLFTSGRCVESGYQVSPTHISVNIPKGKYKILFKVMTSVPTAISMDLGSHHITYHFDTASKLIWKDGGNYNLDKNITSLTLTPFDTNQTILDYLVIVPQEMFNKEMSNVKKILTHVITINEFTPPKVNLDKKEFIATDTRIRALESTKYLSYAFSWGKHWRGNADAIKYISDGYGMTFVAKSNDLTQISYYPDTIFQVSLIISTVTFILLLLSLITIIIKEKYKLLLNRR